MVRPLVVSLCAALGAMAASSASAACTFKVLPIPVTMVGQRPTVVIRIGNEDRHFLIDSGSFTNGISPKLAFSQGLLGKPKGSDGVTMPSIMVGAKGEKIVAPVVLVPQLQFLNTSFTRQLFTVMNGIGSLDGLIGQPMLGQMDVEYDLTGGIVRLVQTDG